MNSAWGRGGVKNPNRLRISFDGSGSEAGVLKNCTGLAIMDVEMKLKSEPASGGPLSILEVAKQQSDAIAKRIQATQQLRASEEKKKTGGTSENDGNLEDLSSKGSSIFCEDIMDSKDSLNVLIREAEIENENAPEEDILCKKDSVDRLMERMKKKRQKESPSKEESASNDIAGMKDKVTESKPSTSKKARPSAKDDLTDILHDSDEGRPQKKTQNAVATSGNPTCENDLVEKVTVIGLTDTHKKRIQFWTINGELLNCKIGLDKLRGPAGIAALQSRKQWIVTDCESESKPCRVIIYDQHGLYLNQFHPTGMHDPGIIAANPSGEYLAIIETRQPKISVFTYSGDLTSEITPVLKEAMHTLKDDRPKDLIEPEYCAFDSDNNLYASFGIDVIRVYSLKGSLLRSFGNFTCATGVCVSSKGNILVADRETQIISVYNKQGQELNPKLLSPGFGLRLYPHALAALDDNLLILTVADDVYSIPSIVQIFEVPV